MKKNSINNHDNINDATGFYVQEFDEGEQCSELINDICYRKDVFKSLNLKYDDDKFRHFLKKHNINEEILFASVFAYTVSRYTSSSKSLFLINNNFSDKLEYFSSQQNTLTFFPIVIDCQNNTVGSFVAQNKKLILNSFKYGKSINSKLIESNFKINTVFQYSKENIDENKIRNEKNHILNYQNNQKDSQNIFVFTTTNKVASIFSSGKYSSGLINRILLTYEKILNGILTENKLIDIKYCIKNDIEIFKRINNTETKLMYEDILDAFNNSYNKYPNNILVSWKNFKYTYKESLKIINAISDNLTQLKIKPKSNIVVVAQRSHWYLLCALSILNVDCVYVPIDDSHPDKQIEFICKDTSATAIMTVDECVSRIKNITKKISNEIKIVNVSKFEDTKDNSNSYKLLEFKQYSLSDNATIIYTSGSTGKPKGVQITRLGILNNSQRYSTQTLNLKAIDKLALYVSFSFDCHIEALFSALFVGASLDIVPADTRQDSNKLIKYLKDQNISNIHFPTALINILPLSKFPSCVKSVVVGGSSLGNFKNTYKFKLIDSYGPTESSNSVAQIDVKQKKNFISVGYPSMNIKFYILDKERRQVPFGGVGELYISGYQLSSGYLNRESINKIAFPPNPFEDNKHGYEKMYKTGDLVKFLSDYSLGYIERVDSQVKIRGNRVELGEVDAAIRKVKDVKDVTVQTVSNNNTTELVAYVVSYNKNIKECVEKYIAKNKPEYMLPSHIILLDKIPLNINGKVNKNALPKVKFGKNKFVEPKSVLERAVCNAFAKTFNLDKIGINDSFLQLGGDSLKAMQLVSLLHDKNITVADILKSRTPKNIANLLQNKIDFNISLDKYNIESGFPLTQNQLNMYLDLKSINKDNAYLLSGRLIVSNTDVAELKRIIKKLIEAHPILKTRVVDIDGVPWIKFDGRIDIITKDISEKDLINLPLNIERGLTRFLIKENKIYYVIHHLISDGYSIDVLREDIQNLKKCINVETDNGFLKYASFDSNIRETKIYKKAERYFDKLLSTNDDSKTFYMNQFTNNKPGRYLYKLNIDSHELNKIEKDYEISKGAILCGAFAYLLSKFVCSKHVQFNVVFNDRRMINNNSAVGLFVNSVPIVIDCESENTKVFLKSVAENFYNSMKYSFYPLRQILNKYEIDTQTVFQYLPALNNNKNFSGLEKGRGKWISNDINYIYDFMITVLDFNDNLILNIEHTKNINSELVESFASSFDLFLAQLPKIDNLFKINFTDKNHLTIYDKSNQTSLKLKYKDIVLAFKDSCNKKPNNVCVTCDGQTYTYRQIDILSDYLAILLKNIGINAGDRFGVVVRRSVWYVICSIACLKLGVIYVPIDEKSPKQHINSITKASEVKGFFVTDETKNLTTNKKRNINCDKLNVNEILEREESFTLAKFSSEDPAHIIFTSGTSAVPKGVICKRLGMINNAEWCSHLFNLKSNDCYGWYASYGFTAHLNCFSAFIAGASINIVPEDLRLDIKKLKKYYKDNSITVGFLPSSVMYQYFTDRSSNGLKYAIRGGEKAKEFKYNGQCKIIDVYGSSETSAAALQVKRKDQLKYSASILGQPVSNTQAYILDTEMRRLPIGAVGELYITGNQLAKGYLDNGASQSKTFTKNLFMSKFDSCKNMLATGDFAFYTKSGNICGVGRRDSMVKVRGNRVDIYEVESIISELSYIKEAVVLPINKNKECSLIAFVVPKHKNINNLQQKINNFIYENKPSYMIPSQIIVLDKIPLNVNGKINYKELKNSIVYNDNEAVYEAKTLKEKNFQKAICSVLNKKYINLNNGFVDLGGDSLSAISVVNLLKEYQLSVYDLLSNIGIKDLVNKDKKSTVAFTKYEKMKDYPINNLALFTYENYFNINKELTEKFPYYTIATVCTLKNIEVEAIVEAINKVLDNHLLLKVKLKNGRFIRRDNWYPKIKVFELNAKPSRNFFSQKVEPIDYEKDDMFRAKIFKYENFVYTMIDFNHIVSDKESVTIFFKDFQRSLCGKKLIHEKVNGYDYVLNYAKFLEDFKKGKNDIYNITDETFKPTLLPRSGKNNTRLSLGGECRVIVNRNLIHSACKNNKINAPLYFLALICDAIIKTEKLSDISLYYLHNGRRYGQISNTIACIYEFSPISYISDKDDSLIDIANKLSNSIKENQKYIYDYSINDRFKNNLNIIYNFVALDNIDSSSSDFELDVRQLSVKQSANLRIIINVEDYDKENYQIVSYYDTRMYGDGSGLKYMEYLKKQNKLSN